MTDHIVLDNPIWVGRIVGEHRSSMVVDAIKKRCDAVVVTDEITESYLRTLQMHYRGVPQYLSIHLLTELHVLHKVETPSQEGPEIEDVHRKDKHLIRAARHFKGIVVTTDNNDLLGKRIAIEQRYGVRVLTPEQYVNLPISQKLV